MSVITIEGRAGAGASYMGNLVARELGLDFVDRTLLADVARRVGATVSAVAQQEKQAPSLGEKLAGVVSRMLQRSAVAGMGGDPYFGPGIEHLIARPYHKMEDEPATTAAELDEKNFISTTAEVIRDIAENGNVVIFSRGGAAILRDNPDVLRVGVVALNESRVERIQQEQQLGKDEAVEYVRTADAAQHRYFKKAFNSSPIDPFLYHFMCNTSFINLEYSAGMIVNIFRDMMKSQPDGEDGNREVQKEV